MRRVAIIPLPVAVTADDKRLKAGKIEPDPFRLSWLRSKKKSIIFEDSPSDIRSGVASGTTVIAVYTSHDRSKIENCDAHYVVEILRNKGDRYICKDYERK